MSQARTNDAHEATINRGRIFASGTFKNVWSGKYTRGARSGQKCVAKEFKTGSVYEEHYFDEELNIMRRAQTIIDAFHAARLMDKKILLNTPEVWVYEDSGVTHLIEPMIDNFEKFNSNTGWAPRTGDAWADAMQALSHFSYHNSNGLYLLGDIQGGAYSDGYILTDPLIMSRAQDCGPADLGIDGIRSFFQRHRCGAFCKRQWIKPEVVGKAVFPMQQGTSMIAHLPTRAGRTPLSRLR